MAAKRLAVWVVPVLMVVSMAGAQDSRNLEEVNELAVTVGRSFVSTQTVPSTGLPIHFGSPASFAFNYSRRLKSNRGFGLHAELPAAIYPQMNLNYRDNLIPKSVGALFITPSLRVNIFPDATVSPWVSAGGGLGHFWESSTLVWGGTNPGPTGTSAGVVQFGGGLDTWFWHRWGARLEVRDFYSGVPDLNVDTKRSRQYNYYVGFGVVHRF
ncbi:MAG: hypothetical protein ABSD64_12285 [Terriglobales bacterium]